MPVINLIYSIISIFFLHILQNSVSRLPTQACYAASSPLLIPALYWKWIERKYFDLNLRPTGNRTFCRLRIWPVRRGQPWIDVTQRGTPDLEDPAQIFWKKKECIWTADNYGIYPQLHMVFADIYYCLGENRNFVRSTTEPISTTVRQWWHISILHTQSARIHYCPSFERIQILWENWNGVLRSMSRLHYITLSSFQTPPTLVHLKWPVVHQQLHVIRNTAHRPSTQASYTASRVRPKRKISCAAAQIAATLTISFPRWRHMSLTSYWGQQRMSLTSYPGQLDISTTVWQVGQDNVTKHKFFNHSY